MIEAVEIPAPDGAVLRGEVRRAGPVWAVLVHDLGEDLDAWRPLRDALGRRGVSVLCFDLRGHDAVAFEDSHTGSLAAKRANLWTVAAPGISTAHHDFAHADLRLTSLADVTLDLLLARFGP